MKKLSKKRFWLENSTFKIDGILHTAQKAIFDEIDPIVMRKKKIKRDWVKIPQAKKLARCPSKALAAAVESKAIIQARLEVYNNIRDKLYWRILLDGPRWI